MSLVIDYQIWKKCITNFLIIDFENKFDRSGICFNAQSEIKFQMEFNVACT
jgi:hypothetical protein